MAQILEGDVLDERYLIGATIARGGMSTVYRATDLRLDRPVAAKVMDPRYVDDASFRTRFEREARAVAHLNDESLVNVYDQGTDRAGHVFLIMELVDGGTLRELLRERGPMPPHAAAAVMRSVLKALSVAHSRNMVHRDVKPENVLISSTGKVKLADFGLVRAAADAKITSNSVIVGTVAYLSPEQVTGHSITPASDVYSAGVLLFELLTGSTPFNADSSLGVAMKRLSEEVPPPSELIDGVPAEFDELVAVACMRNPAERFADAAEFAEALDDIAVRLALPPFRVPAPTDSAAGRAATQDETWAASSGRPNSWKETAAYPQDDFGGPQRDRTGQFPADDSPTTFAQPTGAVIPPTTPVPGPEQTQPELGGYRDRAPEVPSHAPEVQAPGRNRIEPRSAARSTPPGRQRTRRGCALWIVIALLATLGMGLGSWWLGSGRYGEVPSITGLSQPQAMSAITDAGFEPVVDRRYHNSVAASQVIGTEPVAGQQAVRGDDVKVLVSLGRPTVPAYPANHSPQAFSAALADRTLQEEVGSPVYSDDVETGGLVKSDPSPGVSVDVGTAVTVYYSKGRAPVKVPDVIGMSEDAARKRLESAGLVVADVKKVFSRDAKPDEVLDVSPGAGSGLIKGSSVTLRVNNGIEIPHVVGRKQDDALRALAKVGINQVEIRDASRSSRPNGRVESVSPKEGELIDPDNPAAVVYVSRRTEVPSLLGRTIEKAREAAEKAGLELRVEGNAADGDRIFWQSPRPGADARAGDTVTVKGF